MSLFKLNLFIIVLFCLACFNTYNCQEIDIIYTNNTYGFLQPCSCPGAPYGGLNRRGTVLKDIRRDTTGSLLLDAGDLFSHINEQEKNQAVLDIYARMNYDAVNTGLNELSAGIDFLKEKSKTIPFVSSNIVSGRDNANFFNSALVIEKKGVKIGVLGIIKSDDLKQLLKDIPGLDITALPPADTVNRFAGELRGKVDFIVVLSRMEYADNVKLMEDTEGVDLIIGGFDFRPNEEALKIKNTFLVQSGTKGHYVGRITLSKKSDFRPVNKLYTLDKSVGNDPEIQKIIDNFEENLTDSRLKKLQENNKYMGSVYCKGCHEKEYNKWNTTKHAKALESLKKADKDKVLGCLSCHTLGFNIDRETGVQCEHCHKLPADHDKIHNEKARINAEICVKCHTAEQSPDFDFDKYIKKVKH